MSSTSIAPIPTTKKASGKKRRPTFRPASQRKSAPKDAPSVTPGAVAAAASTTRREITPPVALPESEPVGQQQEQEQDDIAMEESALTVSTCAPAKRISSKKRKATTGVAIGSSRQREADLDEAVVEEEPVISVEPQVPDAAPGQATLKTFCSRYRTKEKRNKATQKTTAKANDTPAQPQVAPAEQNASSAGPVVQIVNGEIVLQESSVLVPGARRSVQEVEEEFQVVEEEQTASAVIGASYNSFVSRRAPQHWTVAETKKFYDALRQVGPDFATMAAYFDNRTRKQLKRKYQIENTKNPHLIELALSPQAQMPLGE